MVDVNPMSRRTESSSYRPPVRAHPSHAEGTITSVIEQQTAKIPSAVFLLSALGAMFASATFEALGRPRASQFVGMWAPTLLVAGVYNKIVKSFGTS